MKELTAPTSPTKNGSPSNRKGNQRSGNRTSPQKDRSPQRREKSKSLNNAQPSKSTANFQQPSPKLQEMSLESIPSLSFPTSTVSDDAMFLYDEEILLTPENILTLKPPLSPTKEPKFHSNPVKQAPLHSDVKPTLSSEAVDILELLTRKDNVVRLGQAAKKVAEAQAFSSEPIEIPEKKKSVSSPLPSPSSTIFRSPSPPTRDTNVPILSSERFAGPGFCNSPAPQNLPIPAFVDIPVQQPASRKVKSQSLNVHSKGVKPTRLNFSPKKEKEANSVPELQNPRPTHITQHDVTKLLQTTEQAFAVQPVNYLDQLSHQLQSMLNMPLQSC